MIGSIEHDLTAPAWRYAGCEALADRPRVPLSVSRDEMGYAREAFDTLQFFGPEAWRHREDWLQLAAFEADRARLAPEHHEGRAASRTCPRASGMTGRWPTPGIPWTTA